jgi:hypothetical protein
MLKDEGADNEVEWDAQRGNNTTPGRPPLTRFLAASSPLLPYDHGFDACPLCVPQLNTYLSTHMAAH